MLSRKTHKPLQHFRRYKSIIDDWSHFEEVVRQPLPACIWTNLLKTTPQELARYLPLEPLSWYEGAFRCPAQFKPSHEISFLAGHYQLQEEAALLPVALLAPDPSDTFLDLCAAPGNKTAQIAVRMHAQGRLVANDRNRMRLGILRRAINRLGLTNIAITVHDASNYPAQHNTFDKVLADVPCSGEGTLRRYGTSFKRLSDNRLSRLYNTQAAILKRAVTLCKPGGRIAYATCTFAPEENEAIVDQVIRALPGIVSVVPVQVQGLRLTPGLTFWKGAQYRDELRNAVRLWPHHNDTGGFFVAILQKRETIDGIEPVEETRIPHISDKHGYDRLLAHLKARFGIDEQVLGRYYMHDADNSYLHLSAFDTLPAQIPSPIQIGLPLAQLKKNRTKLKTGAAMHLAPHATAHRIQLNAEQTMNYARQGTFRMQDHEIPPGSTPGYVLLQNHDLYPGLGLLRKNDGYWTLESLLPRQWIHAIS